MRKWAIVEGETGRMCVVPERMIPEHCTYGRALCKRFECNGLLDAIKRLKQYEKNGVL